MHVRTHACGDSRGRVGLLLLLPSCAVLISSMKPAVGVPPLASLPCLPLLLPRKLLPAACCLLPAAFGCFLLLAVRHTRPRTLQCGTYSVDCPNGRRACSACVRSCGVCTAAANNKQERRESSSSNMRDSRRRHWSARNGRVLSAVPTAATASKRPARCWLAACCCWNPSSRHMQPVARCSRLAAT
jgi:hypothetical protein